MQWLYSKAHGRNQEHQKTKKLSLRKEKRGMKGLWNDKRANKDIQGAIIPCYRIS